MTTFPKTFQTILLAALAAELALAQPRGDAIEPSPKTMKPGFEFAPNKFAALAGFSVKADELDAKHAAQGALARRLELVELSEGDKVITLRVKIGVSQDPKFDMKIFFDLFEVLSQMPPEHRLIDGRSVGLNLGDECLVRVGSDSTRIRREFALRRQNIFVSVEVMSEEDFDLLLLLAEELDDALKKLPSVVWPPRRLLPVIEEFTAAKTRLRPYEETELTVVVRNPRRDKIERHYLAPSGQVTVQDQNGEPEEWYRAGSYEGKQKLTLIAWRPNLFFAMSTIEFDVAP